ncbi:unnamed protein product [Meloidogyne enterolobii]|uniref:Uncharacterized protein n=1 Tax=Meloidogyne enterolobii TaxID=390850 RepID=A0ACB1AYU5_MELEN
MLFDQRILQNASNVCNHLLSLGPYANEDTPVTKTFCASIRNIELYSNSSKASRENGDIYYYLPLNSIVKAIRIQYYHNYKIYPFECENIDEIKIKINKIINPERSIRVGDWSINQHFQMLNDHIAVCIIHVSVQIQFGRRLSSKTPNFVVAKLELDSEHLFMFGK